MSNNCFKIDVNSMCETELCKLQDSDKPTTVFAQENRIRDLRRYCDDKCRINILTQ